MAKAKAVRFPTEKQFKKWWKGSGMTDRLNPGSFRSETCPIARYLKAHGGKGKQVRVNPNTWVVGDVIRTLPAWARRMVDKFDKALGGWWAM